MRGVARDTVRDAVRENGALYLSLSTIHEQVNNIRFCVREIGLGQDIGRL